MWGIFGKQGAGTCFDFDRGVPRDDYIGRRDWVRTTFWSRPVP